MAGRRGTLLNGLIVGPRWLAAELVIAALRFTRWIHGDQVVERWFSVVRQWIFLV